MTGFDYAAGALLILSGLVGFMRGATREITTVVALLLAAVIAVFALRFTGPIARHAIHAAWLANIVAILFTFVVAYVLLRLIGGMLTQSVQRTALSGLDRLLGLGIGLVRALVLLGGFALLMTAATPPERMPRWLTHARLYPLATLAGDGLRSFAPRGAKLAHDIAPAIENAVAAPDDDSPRYTARRPTPDSSEDETR